ELLAARDANAAAVEHPRRLRPERAVHEHLEVAEPQQRAAEPGTEAGARDRVELVCRDRLPHAQRQRAALVELLPQAQRAEPAVLVVQSGYAARIRECDTRTHRAQVLLVGDR